MSLLSGFQANRAIAALLTENAAATPEGKRAAVKLKKIGEPSIPKLIEALGNTEHPAVIEQLLLSFVRNTTLSYYLTALAWEDDNIVAGVKRILCRSGDFEPNQLFEHLDHPDISKSALGEILMAHSARVKPNILLGMLDRVSSKVRPILYRLLDKVADEALLPDIIRRLDSKQPMVRTHLVQVLARFDNPRSLNALIGALEDPNKAVRQSTLQGLAKMQASQAVEAICRLLGDPDLTVQATAIETLVKIRAPNTVKHLVDVLQDESEYVRRAAVEVLNEIGDQNAIKDLLNALRDVDWWVKVRAADALGAIGGPKVFDAILALIRDEDEFLRRTAVEILNTSKDPRAFDRLIEALRDDDWWVRERAVDALAGIGDERAVPYLITMLEENPEAGQVVIRALHNLGDKRAINPLLKQLEHTDNTVRKEALRALQTLTDESNAGKVQEAATELMDVSQDELGSVASETVKTLITRYGDRSTHITSSRNGITLEDKPTQMTSISDSQKTHALESNPNIIDSSGGIINPAKLVPNSILTDRYHVVRKIGEGAFGTAILVDDLMVNDQFVLKFLNPHVASDENMIQRFLHELRYARKITHENVIRIYDLITFGQTYAISMEYFPSHSLADELRKDGLINRQRGLHILGEICRGMARAQEVSVVHRDLKPANILINDEDIVKIVDFGLAAAASKSDSRLTKSGVLVGTPTYMAPEQVRGRTIDSRTDIYTLGIIMYELFSGQAPYSGEESMAILFKHVEGKAKPPGEINPEIPKSLEAIITKAMAVDPEQRFQTFDELRMALKTVASETGKA
ncbi:MAG: HEAT repeat domain-containing protein [Gammaproteobacteria bacterium]|nr:HEAT repeat domain-containing protein [Gammaproteobacteria bacterium]MCF6362025.1 HEAT repeat domain-containing protein [Gammaproteobacteria bacterium]